jgi:hypothetical protein
MHNLGDGGVELVPIAIGDDFATIFPLGAVAFGDRSEGVRRAAALDAVIGNDGVDDVFRAALGRVAIDAIGGGGGVGGNGEFCGLVAAPLRRLSATIHKFNVLSWDSSRRILPTKTSSFPSANRGIG